MGNVAIVTDSNSGISQAEGKELGIYVIPMPFLVDGKLYFDNDVFVEYDLLKNISPKHIKKLLRALQEKDNTLDNNKLFISAIKIYSLFGYDNSKKIIDDFFTYATPLSCQSSARELHKDERRQFRLENQEKFYYYGMEQDVFLALQNGNFDILKNISEILTKKKSCHIKHLRIFSRKFLEQI